MKLFFALVLILTFSGCSFDNKSGIWKNENSISVDNNKTIFKDFKKISSEIEDFDKIISINKNFKFNIDPPLLNNSWQDIFYNKYNNLTNFKYSNFNSIIHQSKKLTKNQTNGFKLLEKNNLILSDKSGNIIVYSIEENSIISKYNFYKKRFKNLDKNLNLAVENGIVFVSDNIGYIYAYNYLKNKIIWAKNYKIPFLSNIKLLSDKLIAANQNNDLYILNKANGDLIKQIPSESNSINNFFRNNLNLNNDSIFYLNTYGSLYSVDQKKLNINWFINLNSSLNLNLSDLFFGSIVVSSDEEIVLSGNKNFYVIDAKNGSILKKKNISTTIRPLIVRDYVFLITNNNLLISFNIKNGEIIYSYDINEKVAEFIDTKKKKLEIKNLRLANNKLFIFLKNSYFIEFNLEGEIVDVKKLPSKLETNPIFANNSLYYLSKKKRLFILN